ncbi:MAG: hypothetical protein V1814_02385 [Candidatus Moraniibacteriota bacterium]
MKKNKEILQLSEEILSNIEMGDLSLEKIISKCKKLARLRDDYAALKWFTLELHGYDLKNMPTGFSGTDLSDIAINVAGRGVIYEDPKTGIKQQNYWIYSIPELESAVMTDEINFKNITFPKNFTPAITKAGNTGIFAGSTFATETYATALNAAQQHKAALAANILRQKSLLARISSNIHNYVLNINMQLKFENITESIFQETKLIVDKKLGKICPNSMRMFLSCYDRMRSGNPEDWSQAMSTCRNILKEFADFVFKPQKKPFVKKNKEVLAVTEKEYKNRILAFIDQETRGEKNKFLSARANDLIARIHSLNDLLSKGVKNEINKIDANMCLLDTYMLLGSIIEHVKS